VAVASWLAGAVIVALAAVALQRLSAKGQLDAAKWRPLTQWSVIRFLGGRLLTTLEVALAAMALTLAVGTATALGRLARGRPVRWLAGLYVELFRGLPLLSLILFAPLLLPRYGIDLSIFWYLVVALVAYNGAVMAEIFKAGILSLDRGQSEAATALGMTYWQSMLLVVVPQAARRMVPAVVSQLVTLLKDTSLGYVIAAKEFLGGAKSTGEFFSNPLQTLAVAALVYIAVNGSMSRLARMLELRQRRRYGAGAISVAGVEDLAVLGAESDSAA
jgi:glutamate transport system permease protein